MTREQKYPDTEWFTYYNANPHNRKSEDCVIRAICTATGLSWENVLINLTQIGVKDGYVPNDPKCFEKYLKSLGWIKCSEPRNMDNTKMLVKEFLNKRKGSESIIAYVGSHHVVAIINKKVHDIWDSSKQTMHTYWVKSYN